MSDMEHPGEGSTDLGEQVDADAVSIPDRPDTVPDGPEEPYGSFWEPPPPPGPAREDGGRAGRGIALFLAALLGAGVGGGAAYVALDDDPAAGVTAVRVAPPVEPGQQGPAEATARVAQAVLPSIVQVAVQDPFGRAGLGSGVMYTSDGFIITNDHVVAGAEEIVVNLPTGEQLPAAVVGTARPVGVDIAVLKVVPDEGPLPAATFGSSETLQVGELAVAIGSPFGLESTVTSGIISGLHRNPDLGPDAGFPDAIQTDAAINQGNSGGALANSRGEVIGINTAILGGSGNVGVGFAIPIDLVRNVADQIIATGAAELAFLGVSGDDLIGSRGARVGEVIEGTAAEEAGIRVGDVIVELDGVELGSFSELVSLLLRKQVGERVDIIVLRGDDRVTVTATLGSRPRN